MSRHPDRCPTHPGELLREDVIPHWEALDADLLAGRFGTRAYMARRAGQATSPAKAAARANGAKGGRPRKQV